MSFRQPNFYRRFQFAPGNEDDMFTVSLKDLTDGMKESLARILENTQKEWMQVIKKWITKTINN